MEPPPPLPAGDRGPILHSPGPGKSFLRRTTRDRARPRRDGRLIRSVTFFASRRLRRTAVRELYQPPREIRAPAARIPYLPRFRNRARDNRRRSRRRSWRSRPREIPSRGRVRNTDVCNHLRSAPVRVCTAEEWARRNCSRPRATITPIFLLTKIWSSAPRLSISSASTTGDLTDARATEGWIVYLGGWSVKNIGQYIDRND